MLIFEDIAGVVFSGKNNLFESLDPDAASWFTMRAEVKR